MDLSFTLGSSFIDLKYCLKSNIKPQDQEVVVKGLSHIATVFFNQGLCIGILLTTICFLLGSILGII
ncbi:MAG: hypothetical protein MUO73_03440 [Thermoplasmata archaeon]|nr:hypothetical protein [Thermoplasmata archaeon]